jgi:hypothetical protein
MPERRAGGRVRRTWASEVATTPVPLWVSAAIGVGNTLEAVAGAWLLRRAGFRREIDRVRDVLALAGLAALLATAISATVGVSSLWLSGTVSGGELRGAWAVWGSATPRECSPSPRRCCWRAPPGDGVGVRRWAGCWRRWRSPPPWSWWPTPV